MTRLKRMIVGQNPIRTFIRAGILAICAYLIFGFVVRPVRVQGISMYPTIQNHSLHLLNLWAFEWKQPERGDIVAVAMPGAKAYYMKRILGLPGETVSFSDGSLFINSVAMEEDYLAETGDWSMPAKEIPAGYYFIAGDNRLTPFEGHTLGLVERKRLAGALLW